jgi:hypothetical protein
MKYSVSLDPNTVIEHVVDMDIWQDRIWVIINSVYIYTYMENANTQFMQLAEQFGFTLDYQPDVTDYTGFVFVRHPYDRIAGQYWRAMVNRNWTLDLITENAQWLRRRSTF